jgi:hypothetical protein
MSRGCVVVIVAGGRIGKIERRRIMPRLPIMKQTRWRANESRHAHRSGPLPL